MELIDSMEPMHLMKSMERDECIIIISWQIEIMEQTK